VEVCRCGCHAAATVIPDPCRVEERQYPRRRRMKEILCTCSATVSPICVSNEPSPMTLIGDADWQNTSPITKSLETRLPTSVSYDEFRKQKERKRRTNTHFIHYKQLQMHMLYPLYIYIHHTSHVLMR
jgi:hypothetical protein